MVLPNSKRVKVRCTKCNELILRNRELIVNKRTICLGCAVEKGIAQKCDIEVEHKLNCTKKAGFGDDDCHYCGFMNIHMMRKLGFENTIKGSWFKRTSNPKVLVIYE